MNLGVSFSSSQWVTTPLGKTCYNKGLGKSRVKATVRLIESAMVGATFYRATLVGYKWEMIVFQLML